MKATIWLVEDRANYLINFPLMEGKVQIINKDDNEICMVEITIDDRMDILNLFHAGINYGADMARRKA
jgi:hypothetical protein